MFDLVAFKTLDYQNSWQLIFRQLPNRLIDSSLQLYPPLSHKDAQLKQTFTTTKQKYPSLQMMDICHHATN